MKLRRLFVFASVLVVVGACGSDDPATYPDANSLCDAKATAECKVAAGPCAVSAATCHSTRMAACTGDASQAVAQGRAYTQSLAEACLRATDAVYADRVPDATKEASFDDACARVFAGSKTLSQACTSENACVVGLVCDVEKGFCGVKAVKKNNEPCNNPGEICDVGLYCQTRSSSKFCSPKAKEGDTCTATFPCDDDFTCKTTCLAKLAAGDPCDTSAECITDLCNVQKKCAARQFPTTTGTCADFGGT